MNFGKRYKNISNKSILFPIKNSDKIPTREPTTKSATEKELAKEPEIEPEKATEPTKSTKEKLNAKYLHENCINFF